MLNFLAVQLLCMLRDDWTLLHLEFYQEFIMLQNNDTESKAG